MMMRDSFLMGNIFTCVSLRFLLRDLYCYIHFYVMFKQTYLNMIRRHTKVVRLGTKVVNFIGIGWQSGYV